MVSIVIYGIIAIALAAAAGYAMLVFTSTAQQTTQMQENSVRMEQALTALRASSRAVSSDGTLYVPAGVNPGDPGSTSPYTTLPTSLGVVGASPWGMPYQYCPVAQIAAVIPPTLTGISVVNSDGTTYPTNTYTGTSTGGIAYVISGTFLPIPAPTGAAGYLAFITSGLGPGQLPPPCSAITFTTNGPIVAHGTVRGIAGGLPFSQRAVATQDRLELYTQPDGLPQVGDGSGVDVNNLMPFGNAVAMWRALQPRLTLIYLQDGTINNFNSDGNLAELRPYARSEAPSLVFGTINGSIAANNVQGPAATLNLEGSMLINTPMSFNNLNVVSVGAASIQIEAPVTFFKSTLAGEAGGNMIVVVDNSVLNIQDCDTGGTKPAFNNITVDARNSKLNMITDYLVAPANLPTVFSNTVFSLLQSDLLFIGTDGPASYIINSNYSVAGTYSSPSNSIIMTNSRMIIYDTDSLYIGYNADGSKSLTGGNIMADGSIITVKSGSFLNVYIPYPNWSGIFLNNSTLVGENLAGASTINISYLGGAYASALDAQANSAVDIGGIFTTNNPTIGTGSNCLYLDNSRFSVSNVPNASSQPLVTVNCSVGGGTTLTMLDGSVFMGGPGATINLNQTNSSAIAESGGSLISLYGTTLNVNTTGTNINGNMINVADSQLSLFVSQFNLSHPTNGWRTGIYDVGGFVSFNQSSLTSTTSFAAVPVGGYGAPLAIMGGGRLDLNGTSSSLATISSGGSTSCIYIENPDWTATGYPQVLIPKSSLANYGATLGNRYFDPNTLSGAAGATANTVDGGGTGGAGSPTVTDSGTVTGGTYSGTVDPTTLDEAIQNLVNSENIGRIGNFRFSFFSCT